MTRKTGDQIMSAVRPNQIFSMNLDTLEQEKDEYLEQFKPKEYNTIKNFMITQKVIQLYRQALDELEDENHNYEVANVKHGQIELTGTEDNQHFIADYQYVSDIKLGKMFVTENNVVFVIERKYEKYYKNYIQKTKSFPHLDKNVWKTIEYTLPKLSDNFQDIDGNWVIILDKPCKIYPLKEILDFFDGKMQPEYVSSILTRLYNFMCYIDLIGMHHNGITVENLFFAPGRTVDEGESYSVEDMRLVSVYGGWFFTTGQDEKIQGMPKKIRDILKSDTIKNGYSSFEVDALSIRQVGRELLGDITGENLENVPSAFEKWINDSYVRGNSYEEFSAWEKARKRSFGKHRFVEMDVSID